MNFHRVKVAATQQIISPVMYSTIGYLLYDILKFGLQNNKSGASTVLWFRNYYVSDLCHTVSLSNVHYLLKTSERNQMCLKTLGKVFTESHPITIRIDFCIFLQPRYQQL